jgi:ATP/maltotriose-dependent transcriptional regulator MalT
MCAKGMSNREIGETLNIAENTVRTTCEYPTSCTWRIAHRWQLMRRAAD